MSFSGFGGFGSNNQQQQQQQPQTTGFGAGAGAGAGFGNTGAAGAGGGGFGSTSTSSPFGNTGNAFGSSSGGFGTGGGFGANTTQQNPMFGGGQNKGFGTGAATTGSGFGQNTGNTAFGSTGFGGGAAGGGFGNTANTTGGNVFGANKPATSGGFGTTGQTGGSMFGGGGTSAGTGFGAASGSGTTGAFGSSGTALGGAVPAAEGTANPTFSPFTDKDGGSTNNYQSVSFMQPYQKYSFEELRVADYNHGRRYANASGQPGAFGNYSGFGQQGNTGTAGGFGTANTSSPFGGGTSAPSGFGQTQTSGFGAAAGNSLFGASKPATSAFGQTSGTSQPSAFGTAGAGTTGAFGSSTGGGFGTGAAGGTGTSLFGNTQNKGFGTGTGTGTGFGTGLGQQPASSGTGFGGTTATASPFGGQQQQAGAGTGAFGGFGQNQAQTQNKPAFGGFGAQQPQQQQQPQGQNLFGGGGTTGGTGMFGGAQQQQGNSLFGNNAAGQQGGTSGLFGNTQQQPQQQEQKPSLFPSLGSGNTGTTGGGFGFGNTQQNQQQQQGGGNSLFGNAGAQQQQKPGLFGSSTGQTSLFGQQNTATNTGSAFNLQGANQGTQQQPATGGFGSSLFSQSQPQQQQQQPSMQQSQSSGLQTSLLDGNPYGSQSIFSGLPAPNTPSPGPLATPLSASMKQKQRTPLPMYKISPNAANRLVTPPTRQGYGFSYSTYGSSSSSSSTPSGLGNSILGGSLRGGSAGRSFSKSFSGSNLRKTWDPEADSILSPGAFSAGGSRSSTSNLKRLTIDRNLRTDLFSSSPKSPAIITNGEESTPSSSKLKKKVSFDDAAGPGDVNGGTDSAVVRVETESPHPTPEELGFLRSARKQNKPVNESPVAKETDGAVNGVSPSTASRSAPQMEQVRGKELAVVPEGQETESRTPPKAVELSIPKTDPRPGEYWMRPSREEISKMSREEQKSVSGFTVGRQHCGNVTFDRPVDLTSINLDDLYGKIVKISTRCITVYPEPAFKPPRGSGLNVPSTLRIENSWPRSRERRNLSPAAIANAFEKHRFRLVNVDDTKFISYDKPTGTWVFTVQHYTTYGLDYEDDDDEGENFDQSALSDHPDSDTSNNQTPTQSSIHRFDQSIDSTMSGDDSMFGDSMMGLEDDTFEFKKRKVVPGAFDNQAQGVAGASAGLQHDSESDEEQGSFLEESSMGSESINGSAEQTGTLDSAASVLESDGDEEMQMDMAGSFPAPDQTVELSMMTSPLKPNPIQSVYNPPSPTNLNLNLHGNWAEQLNRTISPRKQDRQALRDIQNRAFVDRNGFEDGDGDETPTKPKPTQTREPHFATSIDLMNSLFGQPKKQASPFGKSHGSTVKAGLKWPYQKKPKTFAGKPDEMDEVDMSFHNSRKPRWGPFDELILPTRVSGEEGSDSSADADANMITMTKLDDELVESHDGLQIQRTRTKISIIDDVPFAQLDVTDFKTLAESVQGNSMSSDVERWVWQLANILFNDDIQDDISDGVPAQLHAEYRHRIKKDRLSRIWEEIIRHFHPDMDDIRNPEERAFAYLCSHRVEEACKLLIDSGNAHLATLISQIGRDRVTQDEMKKQIDSWRQQDIFSEMSEPIRALYELLAGNCVRSEGKPNAHLEDRASNFNLSGRFQLDWIQAFGLRLWYGISDDDPIEVAVGVFHHDLYFGKETEYPVSLSVENQKTGETIADHLGREHPLWILLKAYTMAVSQGQHPEVRTLRLPEAVSPEAVSGSRLHNRLSFQLHHHLSAVVGRFNCLALNKTRADQLTTDYAWELATTNQYAPAFFTLLHLSRPTDRERSLKEMLARFAVLLPSPTKPDGTPDSLWHYLTTDLKLPPAWIWTAKALYARSSGNISAEVDFLIHAKHWNEAHDTFCHVVAPKKIIEKDYATLASLIGGFGESPERKIRGWVEGGAVYGDFLRLAMAKGGWRDQSQLKRLVDTLGTLGGKVEKGSSSSLEEKVAFREMSRLVAGWVTNDAANTIQSSAILNLPLARDARLIHTAEASKRYYTAIMAGGAR